MQAILIKVATTVHRAVYRLSRGRVGGGKFGAMHVIMLTTTGAKSGKRRTAPLTVLPDDARWLAIASNGGQVRHPNWFVNLRANPAVTIGVRGKELRGTARAATPEERAVLWPRITAVAKNYAAYQKKTKREIPVVILESTP